MFESFRFVRRFGAAGVILALLALFGLGSLAGPAHPALAASHSVSIVDFAFNPASLTIAVGDTVTWTNSGQAPHTSTADNGAWDSGMLQPGASFSHTFTAAGTFSYHCNVHPFMTATITVTAAAAAAPAAQPVAAAPAAAAPAQSAPASPAQPAAPATAARAAAPVAAPAGQSVAAAPQLPSTGNGGLLDPSHGGDSLLITWVVGALLGIALAGSGLALLARRSGPTRRM